MKRPSKISFRRDAGLWAAIAAAGTVTELSERIGCSKHAVCQWERVPPAWVRKVVSATGVPDYILRPDMYERPAPVLPSHCTREAAQ